MYSDERALRGQGDSKHGMGLQFCSVVGQDGHFGVITSIRRPKRSHKGQQAVHLSSPGWVWNGEVEPKVSLVWPGKANSAASAQEQGKWITEDATTVQLDR